MSDATDMAWADAEDQLAALLESLEITEAVIDAGYSAMCDELDKWELVGPMRAEPSGEVHHDKPVMVEPYMVRPRPDLSAINYAQMEPVAKEVMYHKFKDKAYAVAFIQWNGLKAALQQFTASATNRQQSDTANPDAA